MGFVLKTETSGPIPNADIYLDGKKIAKSNKDGSYKLEKLHIGTYKLKAEADRYKFNEITTNITPNSKKLPDLVPNSFKICGSITSDQSQTITFTKVGSTTFLTTNSNANNGSFCEYLSPGKYDVQVVVNSSNKQKGLQYVQLFKMESVSFIGFIPDFSLLNKLLT